MILNIGSAITDILVCLYFWKNRAGRYKNLFIFIFPEGDKIARSTQK